MEITKLSASPGIQRQPFSFDPAYGLDLEGLLEVRAPDAAPSDFADFWQRRYRQAMATPVEPLLGPEVGVTADGLAVFEVSFTSVGGIRIGGWLVAPTDGEVDRGFVIGHGYGGREAP